MKVRWACGARRRGLATAAGCVLAGAAGVAAAFALVHGATAATVPTTIPGTVSVSTPVVTTAVSTPVVTTAVSTPVATTTVATPVATTTVSAPVVTTTVATPVATTSVSTPAVSAPAAPSRPAPGSPATPSLPATAATSGPAAGAPAGTTGSSSPFAGGGTSPAASTGSAGGARAGGSAVLRPSPRGSRRPARLLLRLPRPGSVLLVFRGPGRRCDVAGTLRVRAGRGATAVPLTGRVRGGRLPEGVFRLDAYALARDGTRALVGTVVLALAYDASGRAIVRPVERRFPACSVAGAGLLVGVPVVGERHAAAAGGDDRGDGDTTGAAGGVAGSGGGSSSGDGGGEEAGFAPFPALDDPSSVGGVAAWAFAGLAGASFLLFLGLLGSYVVRALRG